MLNEPIAVIRTTRSHPPFAYRLMRYNGVGSQSLESRFRVKNEIEEEWKQIRKSALESDSNEFRENLEGFGQNLFKAMISDDNESLDSFFGISDRRTNHPLLLFVDNGSDRFPWELLHDGNDFLFRKYAVGRVKIGRRFSIPGGYSKGKRARILAPEYSDRSLDFSTKEPLRIEKAIKKIGYWKTKTIRSQGGLNWFLKDVGLFHFTGHATRTLLALEPRAVKASNLKRRLKEHPPFLVFLNACETGVGRTSAGLVRSLIDIGVENLICTFWEIDDKQSTEFAVRFYTKLNEEKKKKDCFLGLALLEARKKMQGCEWNTFPAFHLYGRPSSPPIY